MSGFERSYSYIPDDDLRILRGLAEQATSLRDSNIVLQQLCNRKDAELAGMRSNAERLERRLTEQKSAFSKETQALRTQIQQTVKDSNERLLKMSQENEVRIQKMHQTFTRELTDAIGSNNRKIEEAMKRNTKKLESEMRELEKQVNSEIQGVHERVDDVESRLNVMDKNHATLLEGAWEYEKTAQILCEEIEKAYRVEMLCPGRMQSVLEQLKSAGKEIKDAGRVPENSATARREARSAFEAAFQLREDVVKAEQEWRRRFEEARQAIVAAAAQMEVSRELEHPMASDVKVDVDFWTGHDLTAIKSRLDALTRQMDSPAKLTFSDLDGMKSAGIQISREIDDTVVFAAAAFTVSQERCELAQDIADRLEEKGIDIVDYGYQGNDFRTSHRLHLRNKMTGFEMMVIQTPEVQGDGKIVNRQEWEILSYGTRNSDEGRKVAIEILSSLADLGLGLKLDETCGAHGFRDSETNRREKITNIEQWLEKKQSLDVIRPSSAVRATV